MNARFERGLFFEVENGDGKAERKRDEVGMNE